MHPEKGPPNVTNGAFPLGLSLLLHRAKSTAFAAAAAAPPVRESSKGIAAAQASGGGPHFQEPNTDGLEQVGNIIIALHTCHEH
jgi:hypothetical protein